MQKCLRFNTPEGVMYTLPVFLFVLKLAVPSSRIIGEGQDRLSASGLYQIYELLVFALKSVLLVPSSKL